MYGLILFIDNLIGAYIGILNIKHACYQCVMCDKLLKILSIYRLKSHVRGVLFFLSLKSPDSEIPYCRPYKLCSTVESKVCLDSARLQDKAEAFAFPLCLYLLNIVLFMIALKYE